MIPFLTILGVGLTALGSYNQAKSQKQQAEFLEEQAANNAIIAEQNARAIGLQGRQAIYEQRRMLARSLSGARAAVAGTGLVIDEAGTTPQALLDSMVASGELDIMVLQQNIENEQRRARIEGDQYEAQATQYGMTASGINPFLTGLTAGVSAATASSDILFSGGP